MEISNSSSQNLTAKNVLITGGSRGIGKAIAMAFAAEGANLFLVSKNESRLSDAVNELKKLFPSISIYSKAIDLSTAEGASSIINEVNSLDFSIDILVNNAGHFAPGAIIDEETGSLEKMIASNLYSAYYVSRALLPTMLKKNSGHIFNICSVASLKAYPGGGSYSISKFALKGFNDNLRNELLDKNIKVTGVYPGAVLTDSWNGFDNSSQRIMEASDIAQMIVACAKLTKQAVVEEIIIRPQLGDL